MRPGIEEDFFCFILFEVLVAVVNEQIKNAVIQESGESHTTIMYSNNRFRNFIALSLKLFLFFIQTSYTSPLRHLSDKRYWTWI
jgi:hypothetical protein